MDDNDTRLGDPCRAFQCPGETRPIDRATHLKRLASFYPACLKCPARDENAGLTSLQLEARAEVERSHPRSWQWDSEGLKGTTRGGVNRDLPMRFASAFAAEIWGSRSTQPTVFVGSDGGWTTADLVPAICRALQLAGCIAVEVGAVTSPCLAMATAHQQASAALWIGNAIGEPHSLAIQAYTAGGLPASSPGMLDAVRARFEAGPVRFKRNGGILRRFQPEDAYLASLENLFHGLRPLNIVVATMSETFMRYWQRLSTASACRAVHVQCAGLANFISSGSPDTGHLDAVARQVIIEGSHFGMWIDGCGERCHLIDERGELVVGENASRTLESFLKRHNPQATFIRDLESASVNMHVTRQQMAEQMTRKQATFGSGGDRYWLGGQACVPDALATLCLLLKLLSESDRPLSDVLDAAHAEG